MYIDNLGEVEIVGTHHIGGVAWIEIETPTAFTAEGEQLLTTEAARFIGEIAAVVQYNHGLLLRAEPVGNDRLTPDDLYEIGRVFLDDLRTALSPPSTREWEVPLYIAAVRPGASVGDILHPVS